MLEMVDSPGHRVFVGGISWKASEPQLESFFSTHGQVLECKIIMDKVTGKSKGYGFVTFKDANAAEIVKQTANFNFLGKNMNVGDAVRKTPEPNGASHSSGSTRSSHGNYNGNGYQQPYYGQNYYNRSNDTQFYGQYSPDGTFYPVQYYYQGYRGNQQYQQFGAQQGYGSYSNFSQDEPSSPDSPTSQAYPSNYSQFSPTNSFNPYYYNPYYYQYGSTGGFNQHSPNGNFGPGGFNGGFNGSIDPHLNESGNDPSDQPTLSYHQDIPNHSNPSLVHLSINTPPPPSGAQQTSIPEQYHQSSSTEQSIPLTSEQASSTAFIDLTNTSHADNDNNRTQQQHQESVSSYTRPKSYSTSSGVGSPKQQHHYQQNRSSPKSPQLHHNNNNINNHTKPKQHKPHSRLPAQDPSLVHNHVIAGLSKLSVTSN